LIKFYFCLCRCWCSRPGHPNTCRLARSTKGKDKDSPSGGRTEALPPGQPPLPSSEEPSTNPLAGRRRRQPLSGLHIARAVELIAHRRWERTNRKQHRAGGTKGMVKARVAPATELLKDVVRAPRLSSEGFRNIENKNFPTITNKNKPRSDLRDAKQRAEEIRSTYPCRSHSGNVQMNVVGVVVLASPPRDPIRSKRHNGRHLRVMHHYHATTTPPPRSSKVRSSGRWDQQHDGVVLMVESICGQGFTYAREVEERRQKVVKLGKKRSYKRERRWLNNSSKLGQNLTPCRPPAFIGAGPEDPCSARLDRSNRSLAALVEPFMRVTAGNRRLAPGSYERSGLALRPGGTAQRPSRPSLLARPARPR
jgi:hypothetical protein